MGFWCEEVMKICVFGLWHLGSVISACIASKGYEVVGFDEDKTIIKNLNAGKAPIYEPSLDELIKKGLDYGNLFFSNNIKKALSKTEILWVAIDTPVKLNDKADINYIISRVKKIIPNLKKNVIILFSSQMPVGSIKKINNFIEKNFPKKKISVACSPENLRLGNSVEIFFNPDRIIVGVSDKKTKKKLNPLFLSICKKIEWMSIESAEMTKHAINSFLANSVIFTNEIATICEKVGANAHEVENGLKSDIRIGKKAYLSPGDPIAGGTLLRDVNFLNIESKKNKLVTPLLSSIVLSNNEHKKWIRKKLQDEYISLSNISITIFGLTYKPNTNTLRRSLSIELCDWLITKGAKISVYDPVIKKLPKRFMKKVKNFDNPVDALDNTDVLIIGTKWPEFKNLISKIAKVSKKNMIIIDPNHFLGTRILKSKFKYITFGTSQI